MRWQMVRERYPQSWLLIEAVDAHSIDGLRELDDVAVVEAYPSAKEAMRDYLAYHRRDPQRELYVLHTDRETVEIDERDWLGLRQAG